MSQSEPLSAARQSAGGKWIFHSEIQTRGFNLERTKKADNKMNVYKIKKKKNKQVLSNLCFNESSKTTNSVDSDKLSQ